MMVANFNNGDTIVTMTSAGNDGLQTEDNQDEFSWLIMFDNGQMMVN